MEITIEKDRIRLMAENDDDNEAINSIINLMAAAAYPCDDIGNDFGSDEDYRFGYCCIPLDDDIQAHAINTGHLIMEPTEKNIADMGPKTAAVLRELKERQQGLSVGARRGEHYRSSRQTGGTEVPLGHPGGLLKN